MPIQKTYLDAKKELDFVRKAQRAFEADPKILSFGTIEPGELFALRWGLTDDCIMVFRIDREYLPINYIQMIKKGA